MQFYISINCTNNNSRSTESYFVPKQGISVFIQLIETAINRKNVLEQASAKPKCNSGWH